MFVFPVKFATDVEDVLCIFVCFDVLARFLQNVPVLIRASQAINPYELRLDTFLILLFLLNLFRFFDSLLLDTRLSPEPSLVTDIAIIKFGILIFYPFEFDFLPHARLLDFPYLDSSLLLAFRRARVPTEIKIIVVRFALFQFCLSFLLKLSRFLHHRVKFLVKSFWWRIERRNRVARIEALKWRIILAVVAVVVEGVLLSTETGKLEFTCRLHHWRDPKILEESISFRVDVSENFVFADSRFWRWKVRAERKQNKTELQLAVFEMWPASRSAPFYAR